MTTTTTRRIHLWPFTARFTRNPYGKGWEFHLQLKKGAGYIAWRLPGCSTNIKDGWRCRWYIKGFTFSVATNQREIMSRRLRPVWVSLRTKGNPKCCPAWW